MPEGTPQSSVDTHRVPGLLAQAYPNAGNFNPIVLLNRFQQESWLTAMLFAGLLFVVSGCTTVMISESDGQVRVEKSFGFATIRLTPDTQPMVTKVNALGLLNSPLGFSVGYTAETLAALPIDCRVVLWVDEQTDLEVLHMHLQSMQDACTMKTDTK